MTRSILVSALFATLFLSACDKPTVVNVPANPVAVPGPAGATGATGSDGTKGDTGSQGDAGVKGVTGAQGDTGATGDAGKSGDGTTVIITPPAPPPTN